MAAAQKAKSPERFSRAADALLYGKEFSTSQKNVKTIYKRFRGGNAAK
jgi:hypothetical protein